ncbi:hypothetical protein Lepto7375DRAFT_6308 [Leptolyngbya sp. PCC 7375]|nr:hypothetical protein Lepto7375DRAFT_6308 [Leptolyngbya sp. PCC 7375]
MPTDLSLSFFESALAQFNELVDRLSSADSQNWEHGKLERYIHESGTELLRRLYQGHLDLRYASEDYQSEVVGSDGETRPVRCQGG